MLSVGSVPCSVLPLRRREEVRDIYDSADHQRKDRLYANFDLRVGQA